jgi:hypothetical protein
MNLDKYALAATRNRTTFKFVSIGPKGPIPKIIEFQETGIENDFNLAFGDLIVETGDFNDLAVSDNGDTEKVLATIVQALSDFLEAHPGARIYATGSNRARTRLYRIGISRHIEEATKWLNIYGEDETGFEAFRLGKVYLGFLVTKKLI